MTNNEQSPGGNTTTAGAVEMARRIVARFVTCPAHVLAGKGDDWPEVKAALAAIIETTEAAAAFIERDVPVERAGEVVGGCSGDMITAAALRNNDHLKGPKP